MKFENGAEQRYLDEKKKSGKPLDFFEKYLDFNRQKVPELLEKRRLENIKIGGEQKNNIKDMEKAASEGKLVFKRK